MKNLEIKTALQIFKPIDEVFEAIVDPLKMSNYFISKGSGRMEEGRKLIWQFPEFKEDFPIRVERIEPDTYISFYWNIDNLELLVEMTLTPIDIHATLVTVTEKSRENDDAGIN